MLYSLITLSHLLKFILCFYDFIKVKKNIIYTINRPWDDENFQQRILPTQARLKKALKM